MNQPPLLLDRGFAPLFWCQAFAAFNDNFLKTALIVLILYRANGAASLVALAGAVFILPFLIISGVAGELADRYDKAIMATAVKAVEILAASLAVIGFLGHSVPLLFLALAAFGVLAALFGPVKYGLLPDLLDVTRLPAANALIEAATFLAILLGTALGGWLGARNPLLLSAIVMGFSLAACAAAWLIPRTGAAQPALVIRANPLAATRDLIRVLRNATGIWRAALISCWFWLAGIVALTLLPVLVKQTLHRGPGSVTIGLTAFSLGIGGGSWLAARLARGRIMLGHAIPGTAMLGAMMLALGLLTHGTPAAFAPVLILLFLIAAAGALIAVPSFAAIQAWAAPAQRARAIAGANVLSAAVMVAGTLVLAALLHLHATPPALLTGFGAISLAITLPMRRYVQGIRGSAGRLAGLPRNAAE